MKQLLVKIPISQSIQEVIDYIYYSEMEGREDEADSWFTTYQSLLELKEKVLDEEDMLWKKNYIQLKSPLTVSAMRS